MRAIATFKPAWLLLCLLLISACSAVYYKSSDYAALYGPAAPKQRLLTAETAVQRDRQGYVSYWRDVKPLLDSRCTVCHACYDAPCQLKLGSPEGLDRGATKRLVYDGGRMKPEHPTRLFIDAQDTIDWREKQFFPVLNERADTPEAALDNALLAKMLQLKAQYPLPDSGQLPKTFEFGLNRKLQCPTIDEFAEFRAKHPDWGMPYAMPGLSDNEQEVIFRWLEQGAKIAPRPELSATTVQAVASWEAFFNHPSSKQQLVSRYLYEHLFIGHIHFQGHGNDEFFHIVRSKTPPGQAIDEIATALPYDDPQTPHVYYRLKPVLETIVDKTHFVYELSPQRMQRYRQLFLDPPYTVEALPAYVHELDANPFKTFAAIPITSRYQFLLDDAEFFVSGFIKGPVCRGQAALNVIQDRFWVTFIKPGLPFAEQGAKYLAEHIDMLELPSADGDNIGLFGWRDYDELGRKYLEQKEAFIEQAILRNHGLDLDYLWDGGKSNGNAALTVFRHFDSATVVKGFIGDMPKTAWVVDYPIFERLHYLLVAGFNVYGTAAHQLATRKYMDYLRIDAENNFLRFMPSAERRKMHDDWYQGIGPVLAELFQKPLFNVEHESAVIYQTTDYKQDFFQQLRTKLGAAAGKIDNLNGCKQNVCVGLNGTAVQNQADAALRELTQLQGEVLGNLPEMSLLRVSAGQGSDDLVYTLLVDKALKNIAFIFAEDIRRQPAQDKLTIVPGFLGSYPNFFFNVPIDELDDFIFRLKAIRNAADKDRFYADYGIRRSDPRFWQYSDWFNEQYKKAAGINAGVFDLNRYENL